MLVQEFRNKTGKDPIVTIGICVRNSEETIENAIKSIANQDFPHQLMEIVFVDDGSEDGTLGKILTSISKVDIASRIFHTKWKGLGPARSFLINKSRGQYILWVDGDMFLSNNYVRRQVTFMDQNPSVGIAGGCFGICEGDNWVAMLENIGYVVSRLRQKCKPTSNTIGTGASIFRLKAIIKAGGFNQNIKGAHEDTDIAFRIRSLGYSFFVTDALFYHKQKKTWRAIWRSNYWYGYGLHFLLHETNGKNLFHDPSEQRIPLSFYAYKLTGRKIVFLLPINFVFKKIALITGFVMAHLEGYGHNSE